MGRWKGGAFNVDKQKINRINGEPGSIESFE